MRLVSIDKVKPEFKLGITLYSITGQILLKAGTQLKPKTIKRIKKLGYQTIYITDEFSSGYIDDYMSPEIRFSSMKKIKEAFESYNYYVDKQDGLQKDAKRTTEAKYRYLNKIKEVASDLITELQDKKTTQVRFVDIKSAESYLVKHSLNVGIFSILLGIRLGYKPDKLRILGTGALLHDIGMNNVQKKITLKKDTLTAKDKEEIKKHPVWGYEYLKRNRLISPMVRAIVLQHHEKLTGEGYPVGLKGDKIIDLAQIVSIADTFDALTSDRPFRKALLANYALDYIYSQSGVLAKATIIKKFSEIITPYPKGTIVKLSNDKYGIVTNQNDGYPLRPHLDLLTKEIDLIVRTPFNLLKNNNVVIKKIEFDIDKIKNQ